MELNSLQNRVGRPEWQAQSASTPNNERRKPIQEATEQDLVVPSEREAEQQAQQWQAVGAQYDSPSQQSQKALSAYQGVAQSAQREQVQSMFGVDLYA